jgi:shikimate kinase
MKGKAYSYAAGTVINAISTYKGSAFSIDLKTRAKVELGIDLRGINGKCSGAGEEVSPQLVRACINFILKKFGYEGGAYFQLTSEIPPARGLKSSSAAANASILATLSALGKKMRALEMIKIGCRIAMEEGISITGAFDDSCASLLGGIVITDNKKMRVIRREKFARRLLIFIPERKSFSTNADVLRSRAISRWVDLAYKLALKRKYEEAMTLNGFLFCASLGYDPQPIIDALKNGATSAGLSGTGPSFIAVVDWRSESSVRSAWEKFGKVISIRTNNRNAYRRT